MVALAVRYESLSAEMPPVLPGRRDGERETRFPVMRAFPRLAVDVVEDVKVEARWEEEPERWDGMA